MTTPPTLTQFLIELHGNGLVHLVFDCPDRSMNVFSNKAIHELGEFSEWLQRANVKGVLIRSGKASGFCAGADLTELGVAYDMIVDAPSADRFDIAFSHFFPLSHAIRRLETAGKPVAAAIAGVALGGGCELTLGAHYRVITTNRRAMLGLPECAVGLLPGAGGTQRMPRLVGVEAGLEVLLLGRTFAGEEAVAAGLVHALVEEGEEVRAAEAWLLSSEAHALQPWDRADAQPLPHAAYADTIAAHRTRELARMLGHEPAPLAILDCVEFGLMQPMDRAIRAEMSVFARLIQRAEPRNMIRMMFLGKQAYDKAQRDGEFGSAVAGAATAIAEAIEAARLKVPDLALAGLGGFAAGHAAVQTRPAAGYWLETQPELLEALSEPAQLCASHCAKLGETERLQLDHAVARSGAIPAYLGGATGLIALLAQGQ
jgi:3-hydroxyacyl-CoA dehydrogenase/enoyl-CoA hydratase/3-hydroxybutyryl-CoA epimerase